MMPTFRNEPLLELRRAPVRELLHDALAKLDRELPLRVPALIDGREVGEPALRSTDPGEPTRLVALAYEPSEAEVGAAVDLVADAQPAWAARPVDERAAILVRAAELMRAQRLRLTALAVRECAKPWPEADADVCEAIDFLEYYARQAVALDGGPALQQLAGERNALRYVGRGAVAVIAPWNFPVAILTGMTSAALVAGNGVLVKPAEQSPGCGLAVVRILLEAGVPGDVLQLIPGAGTPGAALVRHPRVATIAFTGSSAVGLDILAAASRVVPGQRQLKNVVAELGGKNCIVVDADADLDEVVPAVLRSAYGFAGQKCSAASRVLAHERVADALVERLRGALSTLVVGQAAELGIDVPPVIEQSAQRRVADYVAQAAASGQLATGGEVPGDGWFCSPALAWDLPDGSPVLEEEIFGPVCAVQRVASVDAALDLLDASPYGLTAGLMTRDPQTVERVWRRSPVGNLYVNREITGAMVGRQPFGGNRLSGNGTKAGGPDYLRHFMEPRALCENTMRHGLVV